MPNYTVLPTSDNKNQWTSGPSAGSSAWSILAKTTNVSSPPSTSSWMFDSTNSDVCRPQVTAPTITAGEWLTTVLGYFYVLAPVGAGTTVVLTIQNVGTTLTTTPYTVHAGDATNWVAAAVTIAPLAGNLVPNIQLQAQTGGSPSTAPKIYAACAVYATEWAVAPRRAWQGAATRAVTYMRRHSGIVVPDKKVWLPRPVTI